MAGPGGAPKGECGKGETGVSTSDGALPFSPVAGVEPRQDPDPACATPPGPATLRSSPRLGEPALYAGRLGSTPGGRTAAGTSPVGGPSSAQPELVPAALVPTSLLWGKLPLEKRRIRRRMAGAGFVQATWCWYHPDHWEWAPWGSSGFRRDLHDEPPEEWLRHPLEQGRLVVRDEAYRPLSKQAQRWAKERRG